MTAYVARRSLQVPLLMFAVSFIIFFSLRLGPFNATALLEAGASDPDKIAEIRQEWGLDDPLLARFTAQFEAARSPDCKRFRSVRRSRQPAGQQRHRASHANGNLNICHTCQTTGR